MHKIYYISKSLDTIRRMDEIIIREAIYFQVPFQLPITVGLSMRNSKGFADFQDIKES